jgi:Bacterial PH domain
VTGAVYALAMRPRVVADEDGLTVLNPFRSHRVPWTVIQVVDTGDWVLVHTDPPVKTIYCWALYVSARARRAPAVPPRRSLAMSRLRGIAVEPGTGISPRLSAEAQYLASLPPAKAIAAGLDSRAAKARKRSGGPAAAAMTASWAWFPIAAVAVPLVALVIVLLVV